VSPEEIVRQLWVYKLTHQYGYKVDEIDLEKSVQFGTEIGIKAADIIVYSDSSKTTPKIIVECKKPKRKEGIEQLKSYMNAKGAPVAVWSNGSDNIILYRPYPAQFDDTLFDIPKRGQEPKDVLETKKTLLQLKKDFNFKRIIEDLEELVLADSGADEFNEIFKLIFAKIWDENEAETRKDKLVEFSKAVDPVMTYDRINKLFKNACEEWPGIFKDGEDIELRKDHLQVCVGPIEGVRLLHSNLRIMDDAFEYLLPTEAKKKKGQFFTPRHVVEMCVRMLNPTNKEYVMDPSCGSGGFLLHAMEWCYPANDNDQRYRRKHDYAAKFLWGIDFELRAAKTSRALMLIAGDGHTNIFGPDVSSLNPTTWYKTYSGQALMRGLANAKLLAKKIPKEDEANLLIDEDLAWEYFDELRFDVILANPPFAGERKDPKELFHYELAKPALKRAGPEKSPKEERDVLFIERILKWLKPGGLAAIVLPQGKFNNSSLAFIREWILKKARLLAVVDLHPNTFKPHTGTKTSVLFVQKYTQEQLTEIAAVHDRVATACPDYEADIQTLLDAYSGEISEDALPEAIADLLAETFAEPEAEEVAESNGEEENSEENEAQVLSDEDRMEQAEERLTELKAELLRVKQKLIDLDTDSEALEQQQQSELTVLLRQQQEELDSIQSDWSGKAAELNSYLKPKKAEHKQAIKDLKAEYSVKLKTGKEQQKTAKKALNADLKRLEILLPQAERELKLLTLRGKLELLLMDADLIGELKERWIAAEVAKRLDYPIFMAVSERGGKDNSGDYLFMLDENGNLVEDHDGQPKIDQDLVNYDLRATDLADAASIPDEKLCIAEAFVRFAQKQGFVFWGGN
jgi:type I restriction enzyme M protein